MTVLAVRAPLGWLAPGRLVEDVTVILDGGFVAFAGASAELGVLLSGEHGAEDLAGHRVPQPDEEIDVDGFVTPGVVDRHVHIALADPAAVLAGGVTAVRDLGWPREEIWPLADASESPSFNGPLIRGVGPILTCPGGYPSRATWAPEGTALEVGGPQEAASAVGEILDDSGVSVLKVALNSDAGPTLSDPELVAVCDTAHAREAIVTAHCQGPGQVERALGAGVDELAHTPWSERLGESLVHAVARRMRIVSTLDIHSYGEDTPELRIAVDNLARFLAAGGTVAYGTDLGNGPIPPGIDVREAWHLVRAGLRGERLLEALTFRPLEPGEFANVLAFGGNPLEDVGALEDLRLVIRMGRRVR